MATHHDINDAVSKYLDACLDPVACTHTDVFVPGGNTSAWTHKQRYTIDFTAGCSEEGYGWILLHPNIDNTRSSITYTSTTGPPLDDGGGSAFLGRNNAASTGVAGQQFPFEYDLTSLVGTTGLSSGSFKNSFRFVSVGVKAKYMGRAGDRAGEVVSFSSPMNMDISEFLVSELKKQPTAVIYDVDETNEFDVSVYARTLRERELKRFTQTTPWVAIPSRMFFGECATSAYYDYLIATASQSFCAPAGMTWYLPSVTGASIPRPKMSIQAVAFVEWEGLLFAEIATPNHMHGAGLDYASSVLSVADRIHRALPYKAKREHKAKAMIRAAGHVMKKASNLMEHSGIPGGELAGLGLSGLATFIGHETERRLRKRHI